MSPRSWVRHTAALASGMNRPSSGSVSGMTQNVFGSRGWATSGKPNWLGTPLADRSVQVAPPSVERYCPQWFCWYSVSGSPAAIASLWTH